MAPRPGAKILLKGRCKNLITYLEPCYIFADCFHFTREFHAEDWISWFSEPQVQQYGLWIGVATQAGRRVDEDFPGGGYLFAPTGARIYATKDWSLGAVYLAIDVETGDVQRL